MTAPSGKPHPFSTVARTEAQLNGSPPSLDPPAPILTALIRSCEAGHHQQQVAGLRRNTQLKLSTSATSAGLLLPRLTEWGGFPMCYRPILVAIPGTVVSAAILVLRIPVVKVVLRGRIKCFQI
eukprot:1391976-Rhodomonas_salina.1